MGALPWTILATVIFAAILIAVRLFVIQRAQRKRQRENRQATERLRSLVNCYRLLAGSFTPASESEWRQVEEALAEVVLFGTLSQVKLAARVRTRLARRWPGELPAAGGRSAGRPA